MSTMQTRWTNKSVLLMAGKNDPVDAITRRIRHVVGEALDQGWSGPPFDPFELARIRKIGVEPSDDVPDARTVPHGKGKFIIQFNPNRPPNRVRYSLAHELAHTLFPDCDEVVRNRTSYHQATSDGWQLEALCNIGAAELLMPAGSISGQLLEDLSVEALLKMREQYRVSMEALLIRIARNVDIPCAMFCASRDEGSRVPRYRLDYSIGSPTWEPALRAGLTLPKDSAVSNCIAIGYTETETETWPSAGRIRVECVAIPPYPGQLNPRVVGLLLPPRAQKATPMLKYVRGDATKPRSDGLRIVAHVVPDATPNWGGGGFASALGRRWPEVQEDFRRWAARHGLSLGSSHYRRVDDDLGTFQMIAQRGYGPSKKPRIRYGALAQCLNELGELASRRSASVHMPRIGSGHAGGTWEVIRDMILEAVCENGIRVTVYDLPNAALPKQRSRQLELGDVPARSDALS